VPDTRVSITVGGSPIAPGDLNRVRTVTVSEAMYAQTQVSIEVTVEADSTSNWTSPLDSLVHPMAVFEVTITRGSDSLVVPARAASASWSLAAGDLSTLTIAGIDASADLDREEHDKSWGGTSDAAIAMALLAPFQSVRAGQTATPDGTDKFTPHQRATDWSFLKTLAARNDFDIYVESENGILVGVFDKIDPLAPPQGSLDLGYGALGGTSSVQVQLLAGQTVKVTHGTSGDGTQQIASSDGTGHAMGTQSLGGAVTVLRDANDAPGTQTPADIARALAEKSAFAADLSVTINAPDMPLLRARRTVTVRGLGSLVSGQWLVKSVRHTVTPAGHSQAISLTRNALGDSGGSGGLAGAAAALAGAL
jgi:phage protein D